MAVWGMGSSMLIPESSGISGSSSTSPMWLGDWRQERCSEAPTHSRTPSGTAPGGVRPADRAAPRAGKAGLVRVVDDHGAGSGVAQGGREKQDEVGRIVGERVGPSYRSNKYGWAFSPTPCSRRSRARFRYSFSGLRNRVTRNSCGIATNGEWIWIRRESRQLWRMSGIRRSTSGSALSGRRDHLIQTVGSASESGSTVRSTLTETSHSKSGSPA